MTHLDKYRIFYTRFLICLTELEQFPLDLNILCEETPENESAALTTWKYSFYHRKEAVYKHKTAVDILNYFKILKGSLCKTLVSIGLLFNHFKEKQNLKKL